MSDEITDTVFWTVSLVQDGIGNYAYHINAPPETDLRTIGIHLVGLANLYGYNPISDNMKAVKELLASVKVIEPA